MKRCSKCGPLVGTQDRRWIYFSRKWQISPRMANCDARASAKEGITSKNQINLHITKHMSPGFSTSNQKQTESKIATRQVWQHSRFISIHAGQNPQLDLTSGDEWEQTIQTIQVAWRKLHMLGFFQSTRRKAQLKLAHDKKGGGEVMVYVPGDPWVFRKVRGL